MDTNFKQQTKSDLKKENDTMIMTDLFNQDEEAIVEDDEEEEEGHESKAKRQSDIVN